ncbi:hypothetical protein SODALDRAFT_327647 [Sodiomyces alkalinus F11]|uniref:Uncharacterized protein n=1 Tax=Sodiomyces alkalinus (strain CBS 110278 / VKM F-3762 / F11) TaxID=1314773 RepID=A0A3N2Q9X2_SODAK|nr:hypothetical protein SODALDRAFT_327647 [Sodiomyces alkalinus F11]ROT43445.1 hypothetical protein SODALDRAFT_327647 [Sodiomyces alkalinus F11]
MTRRNIIADSDEDDNDGVSTPEQSPLKGIGATSARSPPEPCLTPLEVSAASTDGVLFQSDLRRQHLPSGSHPGGGSSSVSVHANQPKQVAATGNISSLTSITDPVDNSRHAKKGNINSASDDLTQVTTPGRTTHTAMRNIWDVPSSPDLEASEIRVNKRRRLSLEMPQDGIETAKKRHRKNDLYLTVEVQSPEQTPAQDVLVLTRVERPSPPRPGKRRKMEREETTSQSGYGSTSIEAGGLDNNAVESYNTTVPNMDQEATQPNIDRSISLYVEPHTLTASQRILYQSLHPSPDDQGPIPPFDTPNYHIGTRSSGMTTVAYTTPSQFKSPTCAKMPERRELATSPRSPIRERRRSSQNRSSPDAITLAEERTTESTTVDTECHGPDGMDLPREHYSPRLTRRRGRRAPHHEAYLDHSEPECAPTAARMGDSREAPRALFDPGPDSIPPGKRQSRSRKAEEAPKVPTDVGGDHDPGKTHSEDGGNAIDAGVPLAPQTEKKGRKKRGRPRKVAKVAKASSLRNIDDAQKGVVPVDEWGDQPVQDAVGLQKAEEAQMEDISPTRKTSEESVDGQETVAAHDPADALPTHAPKDFQVATNSQPAVGAAPSDMDMPEDAESGQLVKHAGAGDVAAEKADNPSRDLSRTSSPVWQSGKPLYRVGLSKRSRIAPLLKSLRKT